MTRWRSSAAPYAGVVLLLGLALAPLTTTPAYAGRTITISLTASGPKPASTTAAVGDTVVFTNTDATFVHQVKSSSPNWNFQTRPLAPGESFPAGTLTKPGEYDYAGANLDSFTGKVVVPGGTTASPPPSPAPSPAPSRSTPQPSATPAPATSASPAPSGGSGVVGPPPLAGGFGSVGGSASHAPGSSAPPPNVAPVLPGEASAAPLASGEAVAIGRGRLPEPPTGRRYGLPAVLAAVAALGIASLLVRLLLAHPAARVARW